MIVNRNNGTGRRPVSHRLFAVLYSLSDAGRVG